MACARTRHSLRDTNRLSEDLLPEGGVEGLGRGEINRTTQQLAQGAPETHELEQTDRRRVVVLHQQVEIAGIAGLATNRRTEQTELAHAKALEEIAMRRERSLDVGGIHAEDSTRSFASRHAQPCAEGRRAARSAS